jgi:broad specificity phosphatase PhoE
MVELTFIRHGQAQTGAQDEASYDTLSPLGRQQARWLGEHLASTGRSFDLVLSGTLIRQRDTAAEIGAVLGLDRAEDARLNELDYFGLAGALEARHAVAIPTDRQGFLAHVPQVLSAWKAGDIGSPAESFEAFEGRIRAMIGRAEAHGGRVLMVTSGGVIAMAMRLLLGLEVPAYANVLLQIYNSSLHRYVKLGPVLALETFNAIPHLEAPERATARTWL